MSLSLIIAIILIFIILIMMPLIISNKSENDSKTLDEWKKIQEYGKKINEKTKKIRINEIILNLFSYYKYNTHN